MQLKCYKTLSYTVGMNPGNIHMRTYTKQSSHYTIKMNIYAVCILINKQVCNEKLIVLYSIHIDIKLISIYMYVYNFNYIIQKLIKYRCIKNPTYFIDASSHILLHIQGHIITHTLS